MYLTNLSRKEGKEMKKDTTSMQVPLSVVVKTNPIEVVAVRKSFRKTEVIPEKEASENVIAYNFVQELFFSNFCESPPNQEEDDKARKDAADHTASADASKRMAKTKKRQRQRQRRKARNAEATAATLTSLHAAPTTEIGAVQRIVLPTAHGQQSRKKEQVEVVIKHYHFYQQVVTGGSVIPQGGQDMSVPPPATVLSKPKLVQSLPPLQKHQAAAGFTKRLDLPINLGGIPKLKIPIFDGKISEYQKFKLTFNTAYDNGRNLPKQHLVSLLEMSLQGKPLKFVSDFTKMSIDDSMYACMWQLLDDKYGDRNTEDEFTVGLFKDTLPIKNGSLTEVERIYEIFSIQHAYYLIKDPASLTMNTSLLFQSGIQKLNDDFFTEFFWFTEKYKLVPNFTALITFMQAEFLFAQKEERKQTSLSHKSDITFVKKSFENLNLNNDAMALSECTDLKDHQNKISNQDEDDRSFFTNTRTGQRIPTRGLQNGNQGRTLERPSEKSLGKRKGPSRPSPTSSQFKEGHCSCCKKTHLIPECPKFKILSIGQQSTIIRRDKLCYHCLEGPHFTRDCKTKEGRLCGIDGCELYHHRVLHREPKSNKFVGFKIDDKTEPPKTTPRK